MIETTGEFKKAVKALVKGAIKAKVFGGETQDYKFDVVIGEFDKKEKKGTVTVKTAAGAISMVLTDEVSTRVYNKINDDFFAPIAAQFGKLKSVKTIEFVI